MGIVLWLVVALGAAFALVYVAALQARRLRPALVPPPGEKFPRTELQRLAGWSLLAASAFAAMAAAVVVTYGPQVFYENDRVRLTVTGLILCALAVFAFVNARAGLWMKKDDGHLDERDRAILAGASSGQAAAMLVTLAAWGVALTETYHAAGHVPMVFLFLIFWSCLLMSLLAWLGGVVIGYRRS